MPFFAALLFSIVAFWIPFSCAWFSDASSSPAMHLFEEKPQDVSRHEDESKWKLREAKQDAERWKDEYNRHEDESKWLQELSGSPP